MAGQAPGVVPVDVGQQHSVHGDGGQGTLARVEHHVQFGDDDPGSDPRDGEPLDGQSGDGRDGDGVHGILVGGGGHVESCTREWCGAEPVGRPVDARLYSSVTCLYTGMGMSTLRSKIIRLASAHPEFRKDLLPLLMRTAGWVNPRVIGEEDFRVLLSRISAHPFPGWDFSQVGGEGFLTLQVDPAVKIRIHTDEWKDGAWPEIEVLRGTKVLESHNPTGETGQGGYYTDAEGGEWPQVEWISLSKATAQVLDFLGKTTQNDWAPDATKQQVLLIAQSTLETSLPAKHADVSLRATREGYLEFSCCTSKALDGDWRQEERAEQEAIDIVTRGVTEVLRKFPSIGFEAKAGSGGGCADDGQHFTRHRKSVRVTLFSK